MKFLLNKLKADEIEILSKLLLDISKGILGAPLVVYFLKDFSVIVMATIFVVDFSLVILLFIGSIYLHRLGRKRRT